MLVFGHRGNRRPGPENSLEAVSAALAAGADGVEIDVRRGPGGALVLSHDPLADGGAYAALADVLDLCAGRARVVCEIKNVPGEPDFDAPLEATADALVAVLAGRTGDDIVVSSFDWYAVERARDAGLRTGFLTLPGVTVGGGLAYAAGAGHKELHAHWTAVLPDAGKAVAQCAAAGLELVVWTVPDAATAAQLRDAGAAAVIVDDPAEVVPALRA